MQKSQVFLQQTDLRSLHSAGFRKYQKIYSWIIYITFFIIAFLTIYFVNQTLRIVLNQKNNWTVYASQLIFQFGHTLFLTYFLSLAFARMYKNHKNWKLYIIWFSIYFVSGVLLFASWFLLEKRVNFDNAPKESFLFFTYFFYFVIYAIVLEIIYVFFMLFYNSRVEAVNIKDYKIKLVSLFILLVYLITFTVLLSGSIEDIKNDFINNAEAFFRNSFQTPSDAAKNIFLLLLMALPLFISFGLYLSLNFYKNNNIIKKVLSLRLLIAFLLADFLYFAVEQSRIIIWRINVNNYGYIIIAVIVLILFLALVIWNSLKMNSSVYFFLTSAFAWLILILPLILIYLIKDINNISTKINAVFFVCASIVLLGTFFFNDYYMKKINEVIFSITTSLILLTFLTLNFMDSIISKINSPTIDLYLVFYTWIAGLIAINSIGFLFSFAISLKRLKKVKVKKSKIPNNLRLKK